MTIDKILLAPYYWTLKLRDNRYRKPGRKFYTADVPTLCIGNVTVGGTGKTPHVEMVLRLLQQSERWCLKNIAVLSLGYKRESSGFQQVMAEGGSAAMFGDEPLQIKKKYPGVTVAVDKKRERGCDLLAHPEKLSDPKVAKKCWNREFPAADYIVLDDAFQYRSLKPSGTVVLVDWNRPVFKDHLLPIGRLRDLPERIWDADVIIVSKAPVDLEDSEKEAFARSLGITEWSALTCEGNNPFGRKQTVLFTYVKYSQGSMVYKGAEQRYIYSKKLITLTGIAHDTAFCNYLSDNYKIIKRFSFPDHHKYQWADINKVVEVLRKEPTAAIATTDKDVQRLLDFNGMPQIIQERLFTVPIETDFLSDAERKSFIDFIEDL